jgi:DNA repair protein RadC
MAGYDVHRIADIPAGERPRERMQRVGAGALSDGELLAILIHSGRRGRSAIQLAQMMLSASGGLAGVQKMSFDELCGIRGIGQAKACQLKAAIEIGQRISALTPEERRSLQSPQDVARLVLAEMQALEQEHMRVLLCDTRNRLIRMVEVYKGSLNAASVRIGEVFREAIRANAASLVVVHNHPSGDPTPSPEDVALTRSMVEAGKLLDVEVLDHLIVGQGQFVSLKARGLGFS